MSDSKTKDLINSIKNLTRRRSPTQEFANLLDIMNITEEQRLKNMEQDLSLNYTLWAEHFQMLKDEFNALWEFFLSIEKEGKGWFCVSPCLVSWRAVGYSSRDGYMFGATIAKNKDRNAPMPEKSLAVTFAVEEWGGGVGDERELGRHGKVDDNLVGLTACSGKTIAEQYQASKRLLTRVGQFQILLRLNHKDIGQETAHLSLDILQKQSLVELSEKLFILLNKDLLSSTGLNRELEGLNQKLLPKEPKK